MKKFIDRVVSAVLTLRKGRRHHLHILRELTTLTFREEKGATVRGHILNETTYQSRRNGLTTLRLQKFVTEPTRIDPGSLLKEWGYNSRIENVGAVQPVAEISESRSFWLVFTLPRPVDAGETFTLSEEMDIRCDLRSEEAVFTFQVRDPTHRRAIHMIFEGPSPEKALFRLDNGHRDFSEGVLEVARTKEGTRGFRYSFENPLPGEELRLSWSWPERAVEAARKSIERPNPANDPELASSFASHVIAGHMGPATEDGEDEGNEEEGGRAEDHPLIKAARARMKTDSSGE